MAIWRVVASGPIYGTERWANVFHVNPAGAFSHAAVLDAFEAAYATPAAGGGLNWLQPCPGEVASGVFGVKLTQLTLQAVADPGIAEVRAMNHDGGQNLAGGLPLECSLVISWRTAKAGRSFRGRTYLPPYHENVNSDAGGTVPHPQPTTVDGLAINCTKLINDLLAANAVLCVYSRKLTQGNTIVGGYIDSGWDTQRRRSVSTATTRVLFG